MKKVLKVIGVLLGIFILILLIGGIYINSTDIPSYSTQALQLNIEGDSSYIAEGERMATLLCQSCHLSEDGRLGGAYLSDVTEFGDIYSSNITQHPEHGITDYTDGELAYLLRTGVKRDGQYIPPYMPKFPHLSDADLHSIIAFLRSDHPLVQPSDNIPPPSDPSFLNKMLCRVAFKPLPYPSGPIAAPNPSDKVAYGKYLATAKFDCYGCHSADFKTFDAMVPENSGGYFGGGNSLIGEDGDVILSSNLTMHPETGIGNWTEDQFIKAVKYGIRPYGNATRRPMLPFTRLTDEEVSAIWAYLKTLPIIENDVKGGDG